MIGPCGWNADTDECAGMSAPGADADLIDKAKEIAEHTLWRLSGTRYGLCEVAIRPAPHARTGSLAEQAYAHSYGSGSSRITVDAAGSVYTTTACTGSPRFILLPAPAHDVLEVIIDGVTVPADEYRLSGNELHRIGTEFWPVTQDLSLAPGELNTWTVRFRQGIPIPPAGQYAAGVLACELWKSMTSQECRLPQRVTDITREGVSMTVLDPQDFFDDGKTGIQEVDQFLSAVNPAGRRGVSYVWSPDRADHRHI